MVERFLTFNFVADLVYEIMEKAMTNFSDEDDSASRDFKDNQSSTIRKRAASSSSDESLIHIYKTSASRNCISTEDESCEEFGG